MALLRIDTDRELLVLGATYATVTAFGDDEPTTTTSFTTTRGKVADVVIDLDTTDVTAAAVRRCPLGELAHDGQVSDDPTGWGDAA